MSSTDARENYTIFEITASSGTQIREYVSSAGRVFAVAWQGPFVPEMRQLLGSYFARYSSAVKTLAGTRRGQQSLEVHHQDFVVEAGGHMRWYYGRAYDPGLLPAGVNPNDLR